MPKASKDEMLQRTKSPKKTSVDTLIKCSVCGLPPIELNEGHECRDGYIRFVSNGRPLTATCPNLQIKRFIDSCQSALGDAGIPEPYLKKTFEQFDPGDNSASVEIIKEWSTEPTGWLFLYGDVGTGKTHLACAAMHTAIMAGRKGYIASAPDLLWEAQQSGLQANQIMKRLMDADIIGLDDLGAHRNTPFAVEVLFRLLNRRYMMAAPTIITSNWTLKDMAAMGIDWKRIADRILELCRPDRIIKLKGESKR